MKDKIITEAIAFILICCYIDDVSINNWVPLIYIPPNIMRKKTQTTIIVSSSLDLTPTFYPTKDIFRTSRVWS